MADARYAGTRLDTMGADKLQSSGSLEMIKAGPATPGTGPTGSSRSYPKGSSVPLTPDFNPMKAGKPTYGVEGV